MEACRALTQTDREADDVYNRIVELWTLRLMVSTDGRSGVHGGPGGMQEYQFERLVELLGFKGALAPNTDRAAIRLLVDQRLRTIEQECPAREGTLFRNLAGLAQRIGLNRIEQDLLAFALLLRDDQVMKCCSEYLGMLSGRRVAGALAEALGYRDPEAQRALQRDGLLSTTGLLCLAPVGQAELYSVLTVLPGLDRLLLGEDRDPTAILDEYLCVAPPTRLEHGDFPHLQEDLRWIRRVLAEAMKQGTKGVNILLYGAPGVGKTELVRALAADLRARLYEVSANFVEGEARGEHSRFRAFQFSQAMLSGDRGSLILFDEIEDVFPSRTEFLFGMGSRASQSKAWINKTLESNPVPAFWLSNEVRQIDPAFLRRFMYVLEIPNPPESVRRGILKTDLQGLPVREQWIGAMAREPRLTPAHIQRIATLARLIGGNEPGEAEGLMRRAFRNSLDALGQPEGLPQAEDILEYRLDLLNTTPDVQALVDGLAHRPKGRLCLCGPPGTGKTALAHHLAHRLDKPLMKRTASELLSMWVGETEKALASMFRRAEREGAVLLLDEADSFLYDRRTAVRSWEVTQVNELLVQMEAFEGLFICSTNLMETLDSAVLRRFDVKVRFEYLTPGQVRTMFLQVLAILGEANRPERVGVDIPPRLAHLRNLTPGDFAVVLRKARLLANHWNEEHLLAALEEESQAKHRGPRLVSGFVAG